MRHATPPRQFVDSRIERVTESGCWIWMGAIYHGTDYGAGLLYGRRCRAHRLAWIAYRGAIPAGMYVLHRCDVPLCCNPAHLFLGTHQDNSDDKLTKNRQARGERQGHSRLSASQASAIRNASGMGTDIAKEFGVSRALVSAIKTRRLWKHLP